MDCHCFVDYCIDTYSFKQGKRNEKDKGLTRLYVYLMKGKGITKKEKEKERDGYRLLKKRKRLI
jgi:hypothetical protein